MGQNNHRNLKLTMIPVTIRIPFARVDSGKRKTKSE